jgi:hypothetical protein
MVLSVVEEIYCAVCGDEALFEQPPCVDGHDSDCPDWVCVACGSAVFGGALPVAERRAAAPDAAA